MGKLGSRAVMMFSAGDISINSTTDTEQTVEYNTYNKPTLQIKLDMVYLGSCDVYPLPLLPPFDDVPNNYLFPEPFFIVSVY